MLAFSSKKLIFFIALLLVLLILYYEQHVIMHGTQIVWNSRTLVNSETVKDIKPSDLKYILRWTSGKTVPFVYMGNKQQAFFEHKCPHTNCIVTSDKSYLDDVTKFDVVAFAATELRFYRKNLPKKRSPRQKFVFASIESADNYPLCTNEFDGYFNWTWTYRLESEIRWGYITIRDANNNIVGPNKEMNWIKLEDMDPISDEYKKQLRTKAKAAAWFVSNCHTRSGRELFTKELENELKKYDLDIDIYGHCGKLTCSRDDEEACHKLIKSKYYFYLSFENSFSEDYATEKLLHALNNDAIPVVYGGANYTRFMPDGTYLNARELGAEKVAEKMNELIKNPDKYFEYFKWKKYYSYHRKQEAVETDPYCLFCSILNDEEMVKKTTVYKNFRKWWDPLYRC